MSTVVQAAEDAAKAAGSDPNRGVEAEGNGSNAKMSEWRGASSVLLLHWFDRCLHLHQPFFLQLCRGKRALLFLVPVGPAVLRPRRLKFANRASCTRISVIFFQKTGFWPLGWRGICSSCLASRHRWSARRRGPTSTALNFWKKIPENRAGKLHICQTARLLAAPLTGRENFRPAPQNRVGEAGAVGPALGQRPASARAS
jgi:hypothetical protein